jgi:hypothetical protein
MRPCWLLLITRKLQVWMPPEVYLEPGMAGRETRRWIRTLSSRRRIPATMDNNSVSLGRGAALHVRQLGFPEPWRACPLWVGVHWSDKEGQRPDIELLAMDSQEAELWASAHAKGAIEPGTDPELCFRANWEHRGRRHMIAIHRVKRFIGF